MISKRLNGLIGMSIFALLLGYGCLSYGYVEPVRRVLPNITDTDLTNPDLPKRKGMMVGDVTLHGALSTGITFDPNVYLSNQDEKSDLVYTEKASVGVEIPFKTSKISLDYEATEYLYQRFDVNDHLDWRVRGLIDIELTDYRFTIRDTFRNFTSLPGTANTSRVKQDTNDVRVGLTRESDKFGFDVGYTNSVNHYKNDDMIWAPITNRDRSSVKHIADMTVGYKFLPKTSIVLEDDYGISEYKSSNSPDYYFNDVLLGVKGELFNKLSGSIQPGYRYQDFEGSTVMYNKTYSGFICRGALKYTFSDKDIVDATAVRSVEDSTYKNIAYYAADYFNLAYTHVFSEKLSGRAFSSYQRNDYPTETTEGTKTASRTDNAYGAGFSLRYDIHRWLSAELGYEFKLARSNFGTFDYEDHIAALTLTVGF